jgi:hypothetical protein
MKPKMIDITVEDVMEDTCYSRERVEALFAGRESVTALEFLDAPVPVEDIQYQLFRLLPPEVVQRVTERTATRCVETHALGSCIDAWARRWLTGEDQTVRSARDAADAANAAGPLVAWEAARAAWAAAEVADAARGAEDAVAAWEAAAWAAGAARAAEVADAARGAEERKAQLEDLRKELTP